VMHSDAGAEVVSDDSLGKCWLRVCVTDKTRAVLSPGNRAKPCEFRYAKPVGNFIRKIWRSKEKTRILDDRTLT